MASTDELMTLERVAVLHRVAFLGEVPGHTLVAVARLLEEVRVGEGEAIIERGAVEDWLYVVAEGAVRVHIDGKRLRDVGAGGVVGDLAVLAPAPRAAAVVALEPTLLLRLRRAPFEELLDDRPDIARAVISALARLIQSMAAEGAAGLER